MEADNYTCQHYSRAYLRHLLMANEMLGDFAFNSQSSFFLDLMAQARHISRRTILIFGVPNGSIAIRAVCPDDSILAIEKERNSVLLLVLLMRSIIASVASSIFCPASARLRNCAPSSSFPESSNSFTRS